MSKIKTASVLFLSAIFFSSTSFASHCNLSDSVKSGDLVALENCIAELRRVEKNPKELQDSFNYAMLEAINIGNTRAITVMIKNDVKIARGSYPDLSIAYADHRLLSLAVQQDLDLLTLLIEKKYNLNQTDATGLTPVFYAVFTNNLSAAKTLVENGASLDVYDVSSHSPLMYSIMNHQDEMFDFILPRIQNVDSKNSAKETALIVAAQFGTADQVQKLLSKGANPAWIDDSGYDAIASAVSSGAYEVFSVLKNRVLLNTKYDAKHNRVATNLLFLAFRACQNSVAQNCDQSMKMIIDELIASYSKEDLAMRSTGNQETVLFELAEAQFLNRPVLLDRLVKAGAVVNVQERGGNTPLGAACRSKDLLTVRKLIDLGADVNHMIKTNQTSELSVAAYSSYPVEIIIELVSRGANAGFVSPATLNTPIHYAANATTYRGDYTEALRVMLDTKAGLAVINLKNKQKHEPLCYTLYNEKYSAGNYAAMVAFLKSKGAVCTKLITEDEESIDI